LSTALQYAPAPYASTEELIALAAEAGRFGGIYSTHMRSEQKGIMQALDETIRIGREAHVPVEIWHLKTAGTPMWGKMKDVIAKIEAARASGVDVTADTYAYTAWFNSFSAFVPPWAHDGGDAKLIERMKDPTMRARIRKDMTRRRPNGQRVARDPGAGVDPAVRGTKPCFTAAAGENTRAGGGDAASGPD